MGWREYGIHPKTQAKISSQCQCSIHSKIPEEPASLLPGPILKKWIKGNITVRSDTKYSYMFERVILRKLRREKLNIFTQELVKPHSRVHKPRLMVSEAWSAAYNTLDSNVEHTECAAVMNQQPISQADEWPILDSPCREITSVPAKEFFPMDTCMSVINNCTGSPSTSITSAPLQTRPGHTIKAPAKYSDFVTEDTNILLKDLPWD